jgi:hypothetical protein
MASLVWESLEWVMGSEEIAEEETEKCPGRQEAIVRVWSAVGGIVQRCESQEEAAAPIVVT